MHIEINKIKCKKNIEFYHKYELIVESKAIRFDTDYTRERCEREVKKQKKWNVEDIRAESKMISCVRMNIWSTTGDK